jgi:hypothetical protein
VESTDGANPIESLSPAGVIDYQKKKRRILIQLLAYCAFVGAVSVFIPDEDPLLDLILRIPPLFFAVAWCFADAAERGHRIGRLTKVLLVLVLIVGLPLYLLQTRGLGGFKAIGYTFLIAVAMVACSFVGTFVSATLYHDILGG